MDYVKYIDACKKTKKEEARHRMLLGIVEDIGRLILSILFLFSVSFFPKFNKRIEHLSVLVG